MFSIDNSIRRYQFLVLRKDYPARRSDTCVTDQQNGGLDSVTESRCAGVVQTVYGQLI